MAIVFTLKISSEEDEELFKRLYKILPLYRIKQVNSFRNHWDQARCCYAEILIMYYLLSIKGIDNYEIEKNYYGKPFLKNIPDCFYNISHSGSWVVAVFDNQEVGIDVEEIKEIDLNIARNYFHPKEYQAIYKAKENKRRELFYEFWTLKESYLKYLGYGLSKPLNEFCIEIIADQIKISDDLLGSVYFSLIDLESGYKLAICLQGNTVKEIKNVTLKELYYFLK